MRNKIGTICMALGAALILAALALFAYNQQEANRAEAAVRTLLPQLIAQIEEDPTPTEQLLLPEVVDDPGSYEMTEVEIDGHMYIGYLSIPQLELDLPVMSTWDYPSLEIAPCRYAGTLMGDDLVIMAHNYARLFGSLSKLKEGDQVIFVEMDGRSTVYEVVAMEVLPPTAVEEMTAGDYDLTLFTCTYGGQNRVTVYCDRS